MERIFKTWGINLSLGNMKTDETKILKELIESILIESLGFACFLSNRTYNYPNSKYKTFANAVLDERIQELESYLELIEHRKAPLSDYKKILKKTKAIKQHG